MDREKVITGLECCTEWDSCNKCPYETPNEYDIAECTLSLHKDALALLKEQEAVEPINSYGTFRCRKCKNIVGYNDGDGRGYQNNFCSKCGQAVKWDE